MGKAGRALKQVLESYKISQNKLAVRMSIERTVVYRWTHERTDPTGETIAEITEKLGFRASALKGRLFLVDLLEQNAVFYSWLEFPRWWLALAPGTGKPAQGKK